MRFFNINYEFILWFRTSSFGICGISDCVWRAIAMKWYRWLKKEVDTTELRNEPILIKWKQHSRIHSPPSIILLYNKVCRFLLYALVRDNHSVENNSEMGKIIIVFNIVFTVSMRERNFLFLMEEISMTRKLDWWKFAVFFRFRQTYWDLQYLTRLQRKLKEL